jgi:type VI secretion system protein ImpF
MPNGSVVSPSLFDRLTDYEPRQSREVPLPQWDQIDNYKAAVARDLANLLNTWRRLDEIPEQFQSARESVLGYGLPDYTAGTMDYEQIRRAIERAIRTFEPRLSRVDVAIDSTPPNRPEPGRAVFRVTFRISAVLHIGGGTEPVVFDGILPKETPRFRVTVGR